MDKYEILKELRDGRKEFLNTLEGLEEATLLIPGVVDQWSIKNILFHLTMWEAELVKLLWQASQGQTPTTIHFSNASVDEINQDWSKLADDRPMDLVWQDFHGVRKQLIRRVEGLRMEDFDDPARFTWLNGQTLSIWIAVDSYKHEAEHADQIRLWRENLNQTG